MSYEVIDEDKTSIKTLKLKELQACMQSGDALRRNLFGMILGGSLATMSLKFSKSKFVYYITIPYVTFAAFSGLVISKYFTLQTCRMKLKDLNNENSSNKLMSTHRNTINMYENVTNKLENQEVAETEVSPKNTEEFVSDIEFQPQTSSLDEFPANYESTNVSNKREPDRTVTYKELRKRNRQAYENKNIVEGLTGAHDQRREQFVEAKEYETESKEPDLFYERSIGKHKTKYGDVWD